MRLTGTVGRGWAGALVGAVLGAAFGWYIMGPPTNDHHLQAVLWSVAGILVGFAIAGPPGSLLAAVSMLGTTLAGAFGGGWIMRDEGLGAAAGIFVGAIAGLVTGGIIATSLLRGRRG